MTLGRLVLAWVPVALWFLVVGYAGRRLAGVAFPVERLHRRWADIWTLAEAGIVTLFASLWFDSLGSGGWWLLFLLVGVLAAFPVRLQVLLAAGLPRRAELIVGAVDVVRYLGAGGILAWRLA